MCEKGFWGLGKILKYLKESNQASRMRCDIMLKALVLKIKLQPRRSLMTGGIKIHYHHFTYLR